MKYLYILIFTTISFVISLIITKFLIYLLPKLGFVDKPRNAHIHIKPIPLGGGMALILSFTAVVILHHHYILGTAFFIQNDNLLMNKVLLPGILLIAVGLLDDKFEINSLIKLAAEIAAAVICWFNGIAITFIFGFELNPTISLICTALWIVSFINAFNMVDGIDGLAGGIGFFSLSCMGIIFIMKGHLHNCAISFYLAASCLGFLRYNFHPAKIYMGDVGSMFLGFMVAVMGMTYYSKSVALPAVFVPLFAAGIPVLDITMAVWRRSIKKLIFKHEIGNTDVQKITGRDLEHLHHREYFKHNSHINTALSLYNLSIIGSLIAITLAVFINKIDGIVLFTIILISIIVFLKNTSQEIKSTKKLISIIYNKSYIPYKRYLLKVLLDYFAILSIYAIIRSIFTVPQNTVINITLSLILYLALSFIINLKEIKNTQKNVLHRNSVLSKIILYTAATFISIGLSLCFSQNILSYTAILINICYLVSTTIVLMLLDLVVQKNVTQA